MWIMFEEFAASGAVRRFFNSAPRVVLKAWERVGDCHGRSTAGLKMQVLRTIEHIAPQIAQHCLVRLLEKFIGSLASLTVPTEEVATILRVVARLEDSLRNSVPTGSNRRTLLHSVASKLDTFVHQMKNGLQEEIEIELCRCLFILGQLALSSAACAGAISQRTLSDIEAIATDRLVKDDMLKTSNVAVRSHAFGALGKICLHREDLAKQLVELFVIHLNEREAVSVRNNVLLVLRDFCERYTSLVDRFAAEMAGLLCDRSAFLRKQAVMALSSLLSEEFIHFRGAVVVRFLYALSDPVEQIRGLAESVVVRILHRRNNALFLTVFLDMVCMLNGWSGHPTYKGAQGNNNFALPECPERRLMVYTFLLSLMTNEQRLTIYSQAVTVFLSIFLDVDKPVALPSTREEPAGRALHDVLSLLVAKELHMCLSSKRVREDGDGEEGATSHDAQIAGNALGNMIKRVVCDHVMPTLVQLKHLMEKQHSPFLGQLRRCICLLSVEFMDDLKAVTTGDSLLASEIEFDLGVRTQLGNKRRRSLGSAMADTAVLDQEVVAQPTRKISKTVTDLAALEPESTPPRKRLKVLRESKQVVAAMAANTKASCDETVGSPCVRRTRGQEEQTSFQTPVKTDESPAATPRRPVATPQRDGSLPRPGPGGLLAFLRMSRRSNSARIA
jgi:condensin-2 complex subunit D3